MLYESQIQERQKKIFLDWAGRGPRTPPARPPPARPHPPRPASPQAPLNPFLELPELGVNNSVEMALVVLLLVLRDEFRTVLRELIFCP